MSYSLIIYCLIILSIFMVKKFKHLQMETNFIMASKLQIVSVYIHFSNKHFKIHTFKQIILFQIKLYLILTIELNFFNHNLMV